MSLPQQLPWPLAQTMWAQALNPIIANPTNSASILKSISLTVGINVINHKLGAPLQGWSIIRMRNVTSNIHDLQDSNQTPALTLVLVSSAAVVVDLMVF